MSAPKVRLTADERTRLGEPVYEVYRLGKFGALRLVVEGIVAARLAAQAERVAAAVEQTLAECRPVHAWRDTGCRCGWVSTPDIFAWPAHVAERVTAALRGDTDG